MTKYNKAQAECIKKWNGTFYLKDFLEEFNAIPPEPDPELYQITLSHIPMHNEYADLYKPGEKDTIDGNLAKLLEQHWASSIHKYIAGEYLELKSGTYWKVVKL